MVRKTFPHRASFIAPLNLDILLNNYQDKESDILAHPKWLIEMYELFKEIHENILKQNHCCIISGSILHKKVKKYVSDNPT